MTIDPVSVVIANAWEADHLPAHHVTVATMDRIREETLGHIFQKRIEQALRLDAVEMNVARLNFFQHIVLLLGRKCGKAFRLKMSLAIPIQFGEPFSVQHRRRHFRLRALFLRALCERTKHVKAVGTPIGSG